jgi:hypothetical protein
MPIGNLSRARKSASRVTNDAVFSRTRVVLETLKVWWVSDEPIPRSGFALEFGNVSGAVLLVSFVVSCPRFFRRSGGS